MGLFNFGWNFVKLQNEVTCVSYEFDHAEFRNHLGSLILYPCILLLAHHPLDLGKIFWPIWDG